MAKSKVFLTVWAFLAGFAVLIGCAGEAADDVFKSAGNSMNVSGNPAGEIPGGPSDGQSGGLADIPNTIVDISRNFSPGKVMILLNRQYGWAKYEYTPEDFPEIRLDEVEELMPLTWKQAMSGGIKDNPGYTFKRYLILRLAEKSKENMVRAANLLAERIDVQEVIIYYTPWPQEPGSFPGLDAETEMLIKYDYFYNYVPESKGKQDSTADAMVMRDFFGIYNGSAAVMMAFPGFTTGLRTGIVVADIVFRFRNHEYIIQVWNRESGLFYNLKEAFDLGLISLDDVKSIYELHREKYPELYPPV